MFNALPRLIIEVWSRQIPLKTSLPKQTCLIIIVSKYWLLEVKYFSEDDEDDDEEEDDEEDNENDNDADDEIVDEDDDKDNDENDNEDDVEDDETSTHAPLANTSRGLSGDWLLMTER